MKNLFTKALCFGLCGASLVFLASCAAQKGTLSPNTSLIGANNAGSTSLPTITAVTTPGGVYNKLFVDFSADMDPASINSTTVKLFQLYDVTGTVTYSDENEVTNVTLSYDGNSRRLTIVSSTGSWPSNTQYRLNITNGVRSLTGRPLDGNGNGIAESVDFDYYTATFTLGGAPVGTYAYATGPLQASSIDVYWNLPGGGSSSGNLLSGNVANVSQFYTNVTITVVFNKAVDDLTLNNNKNTLITNAVTGANVTPISNSIAGSGVWPRQVDFFYTLEATSKYKLTIKGGLTGYRTRTDKASSTDKAPLFGRYFDGSTKGVVGTAVNGVAEASDDLVREFTTGTATGANTPVVTVGTVTQGTRKLIVPFNVTPLVVDATNSKARLDETTITPANFQLFVVVTTPAAFVGTYQIPVKQLVFNGTTTVDVYLPDTFYPGNGTSYQVYVKVLPGLKSVEGLMLDANSNNIGGETADVYSSVGTVHNFTCK